MADVFASEYLCCKLTFPVFMIQQSLEMLLNVLEGRGRICHERRIRSTLFEHSGYKYLLTFQSFLLQAFSTFHDLKERQKSPHDSARSSRFHHARLERMCPEYDLNFLQCEMNFKVFEALLDPAGLALYYRIECIYAMILSKFSQCLQMIPFQPERFM